jgi:hypothetical protein
LVHIRNGPPRGYELHRTFHKGRASIGAWTRVVPISLRSACFSCRFQSLNWGTQLFSRK